MKPLTASEVAEKIGVSYDYFQRSVKFQPEFPKPIKLTPKSHPKWRDVDIDKHLERLAS